MKQLAAVVQYCTPLTFSSCFSLLDTISKLGLQKSSVLQHMTIVIQAILEKGIVEYSIVHTVILEYFTIADKVRMFYDVLYLSLYVITL
jgi:pumilio homology domain family member 6